MKAACRRVGNRSSRLRSTTKLEAIFRSLRPMFRWGSQPFKSSEIDQRAHEGRVRAIAAHPTMLIRRR
jgi:hypothetical protein